MAFERLGRWARTGLVALALGAGAMGLGNLGGCSGIEKKNSQQSNDIYLWEKIPDYNNKTAEIYNRALNSGLEKGCGYQQSNNSDKLMPRYFFKVKVQDKEFSVKLAPLSVNTNDGTANAIYMTFCLFPAKENRTQIRIFPGYSEIRSDGRSVHEDEMGWVYFGGNPIKDNELGKDAKKIAETVIDELLKAKEQCMATCPEEESFLEPNAVIMPTNGPVYRTMLPKPQNVEETQDIINKAKRDINSMKEILKN